MQNPSSQHAQLPSMSALQYAAPKGPHKPHWHRLPPHTQLQPQSSTLHSRHPPASAREPRLVTTGASHATAVPTPRRFIKRRREILLAVLSSSILHPLPVELEGLSQRFVLPTCIRCKCPFPIEPVQFNWAEGEAPGRSALDPGRPVPRPRVAIDVGSVPPEQEDLVDPGPLHGKAETRKRRSGRELLRPVRSVPRPRVAEDVEALASEHHDLLVRLVVCHTHI